MTLATANPQRKVRRSNSIFDNIFNELINTNGHELSKPQRKSHRPAVNILETSDDFRIELSAPGLSKKDISIGVEKDILTIESNKETKEKEGEKVIRQEFNFSQFKRTFRLPETIDTSKINANFKNGILAVTLTKKEEAKEQPPRTIEIK